MALATSLFKLGQTCATPGALRTLEQHSVSALELLSRHASGDWGDLDQDDKSANDEALVTGERIFSAYIIGDEKLWVITEHDRSVTTILLPEEY